MEMDQFCFFKSRRVCLIITGASKGFGRIMAKRFAEYYHRQFSISKKEEQQVSLVSSSSTKCDDPNNDDVLLFVLMARNDNDLQTLANELKSIDSRCYSIKIACDLSHERSIELFENVFTNKISLEQHAEEEQKKIIKISETFKHFILIHNAGSTGIQQLCQNVKIGQNRNDYYRLNLLSMIELTAVFLRIVQSSKDSIKHLINITSLAAIKPIKGLVDYCVSKAAREAYFRQLSEELATDNDSTYRILNYSPGPMDTEMFRNLQKTPSPVQEMFQKIQPLKPEDSIEKMFKLLNENQYENGAHIDYFDF